MTNEDIRSQKHLKGVREGVDFDWFAQFVIDNYQFLIDDREAQLRDLFLAVDVTGTGLMSYDGFKMIMKIFHFQKG